VDTREQSTRYEERGDLSFKSKNHAIAYLMGVYLSDGNLDTDTGSFRLIVTDEVFRDEVAKAFDIIGSKYSRYTRQPQSQPGQWCKKLRYTLREYSPYKVGLWLEGKFPKGKDHFPNIPEDLAHDLVAGILDGDGCICHKKSDQYLLVVCGYCKYLEDLRDLFERFSVKMYYRPGEANHCINLRSFVEAGFYFRMPRKQMLVEAYKNDYL